MTQSDGRAETGDIRAMLGSARVVTGFTAAWHALADPRLTSDPSRVGLTSHPSANMLLMDGPLHRRLRALVVPVFTREAVGRLASQLATARDRCIAKVIAGEDADLMAGFVDPLVLLALFEAVGIDRADRAVVARLLGTMLGVLEPRVPGGSGTDGSALAAVRLAAMLNRPAGRDRMGVLQRRLLEARDADAIPNEVAAFTLAVVLHGGYENPRNALGSIIAAASADVARFRAHACEPERFIDEALRRRPPVRRVLRWAVEDVPEIGAAPHDAVWIDLETNGGAQRADVGSSQPSPKHLSFGSGAHRCPGIFLTRVLGCTVLEGLAHLPDEAIGAAVVEQDVGVVANGVARIMLRARRGAAG
jgi:cytochrome P450